MAAVREKLAAIDKTAEELARAEELAENARLHSANAQKNFAGAQEKRRTDAMAQLEACRAAREKAESEAARRSRRLPRQTRRFAPGSSAARSRTRRRKTEPLTTNGGRKKPSARQTHPV